MKLHFLSIFLLCFVSLLAQTYVKIPFIQPEPFYVSVDAVVKTLESEVPLELGLEVEIQGGSGNYTFVWTKDAMVIGSQPTTTVTHSGTYKLAIQDGKGCGTTVVYVVTGETGVDELLLPYLVNVYPNPTIGEIFVESSSLSRPDKIAIYAVTGELVLIDTPSKFAGQKIALDVSGIKGGQYLLTCTFGAKRITRIIIVK